MLSLILLWLYVLILSFSLGMAVLSLCRRYMGYQVLRPDSIIMTGVVVLTVYAQVFILFYKVVLAANIVLIIITIILVLFTRRDILCTGRQLVLKIRVWQWITWGILFVIFAYGASRGEIHYDTGLYHAQSIRWIEEIGVVPGLGNLHNRLAYNSAVFSLTALFSVPFVAGQSLHGMSGFLAWVLACSCTRLQRVFRERKVTLSDFVRVFVIYDLTTIFNRMISPESDYFMSLVVLFLILRWCEFIEERQQAVTPYALLCVLGVCAVTFKLSAALCLLLTIKPAVVLIKERKGKEILLYLAMGIAVAVPFLIRNVILSGWLVYPFPAIDLFSVDWKIPAGIAAWDAAEIKVYGRGLTDPILASQPFDVWFPQWFRALGALNKLWVIGSFLSLFVCAIWGISLFVRKLRRKSVASLDAWLVQLTCVACFLFWLSNAPLVRYGFVFMGLSTIVLFGNIYLWMTARWATLEIMAFRGLVILFALWKSVSLGKHIEEDYVNDYWIAQKDYENYPVVEEKLDGQTVYVPQTGDRVGYEAFPSTNYLRPIERRGVTLKDGFRNIE